MGSSSIDERYVVGIGCRVSVESGPSVTTVNWSVSHLPPGGAQRPTGEDQTVGITCPRCSREFTVRVERAAKARRKQLVYRAVGWLLLLSLVITVPTLFHLGGQTVEEGDTSATNTVGVYFGLVALALIVGPSFLFAAGHHDGVKRLRLVRGNGSESAVVKGHRLF
ncbi:hypothetical protein ACGFYU_02350 [Streptomyces sp. NPDC048337]|uniref:hypothetical protein n=1 Tax=Streptomyces sp. NPDC048337 TaxID=3365535 RepID=UPI00371016A2